MIVETGRGQSGQAARRAPERVTSATKVTVAFPFSQVRIEEPSEYVIALAELVEDLARCLSETAPSTRADELLRRARELAAVQH